MAKYGNDGPSNSGGSGCYSMPQKGIPGPKSPGPPPSMRKALAKKQIRDKGRSSPGTR
jgi:hypothetical protein